jgi:hypothetical protein
MIDTVANTLAQKLECQEFLSTVAGVARAGNLHDRNSTRPFRFGVQK